MNPPPSFPDYQECQIEALTDADLSAIFAYLPPYERLLASEVCRRWKVVSRKTWRDVTSLDLSPIPGKNISAIITQCPNLRSVFALQKCFGPKELYCLCKAVNLSGVRFYDCDFAAQSSFDANFNSDFALIFSEQLKHTSWNELTIHNSDPDYEDATVSELRWPKWSFSATNLAASLTRLQLSGLITDDAFCHQRGYPFKDLELLPNLECLILLSADFNDRLYFDAESILGKIAMLKNLKELVLFSGYGLNTAEVLESLPKLEVLFLYGVTSGLPETLMKLMTESSVLRILLLSAESPPYFSGRKILRDKFDPASDGEPPFDFPARKRFPHGFGSDPLQHLHVFIDSHVSPHVRFTKSPFDAATIHPINKPLPEFLEREDIAPILEGVWVAGKIKETAKHDAAFWIMHQEADANNSIQFI